MYVCMYVREKEREGGRDRGTEGGELRDWIRILEYTKPHNEVRHMLDSNRMLSEGVENQTRPR